ncbi:MAG: glycogen synthase GlgA [Clostridia bacterium]|nr:glycogen synthase GlgA [Clostridia bacterium]
MNILFAASECAPFIKTGGLADVVGALPKELAKKGDDVRVIIPKYSLIPEKYRAQMTYAGQFEVQFGFGRKGCGIMQLEMDGVTYYFLDSDDFFCVSRIYGDYIVEGHRFAFFCRAVIESLKVIGFTPDVLHLNDWQTGLIAALLKTQYRYDPKLSSIRTVYSIHNLQYQGVFNWYEMNSVLGLDDWLCSPEYLEFYGNMNCMKAGLVFADKILTVSPTYAEEIKMPYFGEQLDGLIRKRGADVLGILNGIDTEFFDPATDPAIAQNYSTRTRRKKVANKLALQREMGLPEREDVAVIGFCSRFASQKGLDLIECVLRDILRMDVQMVFLGSGDGHFTNVIEWAHLQWPEKLACYIGFNEPLSHRIYAGCDLFLMPSKFEPCGLSQLISLRYGTIPVVRETGGLRDSIRPYNQYTDEGNGFSFANYNAHEMLFTLERAVRYYQEDKEMWDRLMARAMKCNFGWSSSAAKYRALYKNLLKH